MAERRGGSGERKLCSGPGKLTQALAIDECISRSGFFSNRRRPASSPRPTGALCESDRRVGITKSAELDWRFLQAGSVFVSSQKKPASEPTEAGVNPPKVETLFGVTGGRWRRWRRRSLLFRTGRNAKRRSGQSH